MGAEFKFAADVASFRFVIGMLDSSEHESAPTGPSWSVDIAPRDVHLDAMHQLARTMIAIRRRRIPSMGVWTLRAR